MAGSFLEHASLVLLLERGEVHVLSALVSFLLELKVLHMGLRAAVAVRVGKRGCCVSLALLDHGVNVRRVEILKQNTGVRPDKITYQREHSVVDSLVRRNDTHFDVGIGELGSEQAVHLVVVTRDVEEPPDHADGLQLRGVNLL